MVECKCKLTQQLLWLNDTHIQVSVPIHYNWQKKCYVDQDKDGDTNTHLDRTGLEWPISCCCSCSWVTCKSAATLTCEKCRVIYWEELLPVLGSFMPEHCYKIMFLNQLFSLSWIIGEVHGTCRQSYTQGPSLSNQGCSLVFETEIHWASANTFHNLVRQRQRTLLVHWPVKPLYLSVINPLLPISTSIPNQHSKQHYTDIPFNTLPECSVNCLITVGLNAEKHISFPRNNENWFQMQTC
jgi:hypothetical protein